MNTQHHEELAFKLHEMKQKWQVLKGVWLDNSQKEFERTFWVEYEQGIRMTLNELYKADLQIKNAAARLRIP